MIGLAERYSTEAKRLWPHLLPRIEPLLRRATGSGSGAGTLEITGGAPSPHGMDSGHHTGTISDAQGPQFLLKDGSRQLTGNLSVAPGITIDGVDLGAHAADPAAHHAPASAGDGMTVSAAQVVAVDSTVVRITRQIATGDGLSGGGNLSADRTLAIALAVNPGLEFTAGYLRMGTPATLGVATTNSRTGADHAHAIDAADDVGATPAAKILKSTAGGLLSLAGLTLYGNLAFTGGARTISSAASNNLIVAPGGDLVVQPGGGELELYGNLNLAGLGRKIVSGFDIQIENTGKIVLNPSSASVEVDGGLLFTGAARSITGEGSYNLTIAPGGDLILDPIGNVQIPDAQEVRTTNFQDLVTGIDGFRLWDRGSNYRQLTIGAIKADEIFARVFVADETRIDRGEDYWSKSFGIVAADATVPSGIATGFPFDVTFEDAPALLGADLFSAGDWLLLRSIDWTTGLVIQKEWFYVHGLVSKDTVNDTQTWTLAAISGSAAGMTIKAGSTLLDAGQVGQGWIHLSALEQDGGPFIQLGEMTGDNAGAGPPSFTNYVRLGNLSGVGGIAVDTWGFAAAKSLATSIGSGFEGIVIDPTNGVRLFNADITLYSGADLVARLQQATGLSFREDTSAENDELRYIHWHDSSTFSGIGEAYIGVYTASAARQLRLKSFASTVSSMNNAGIELEAEHYNAGTTYYGRFNLNSRNATLRSEHIYLSNPITGGGSLSPANIYLQGYVHADWIRAADGDGIYLSDDALNVALRVIDGGSLELGDIDAIGTITDDLSLVGNLTVDKSYYVGHGKHRTYQFGGTAFAAGTNFLAVTAGAGFRNWVIKITYSEHNAGNGFSAYAIYEMKRNASGSITSQLIMESTTDRRIAATVDGANNRVLYRLQTAAAADVAVTAENVVYVEILESAWGFSFAGSATYAP